MEGANDEQHDDGKKTADEFWVMGEFIIIPAIDLSLWLENLIAGWIVNGQ